MQEKDGIKCGEVVIRCLLFSKMLLKAEFTANWKLFLLEYAEFKAATQIAASTFLSLIQPVQANSNEPFYAKDRETKHAIQVNLAKNLNYYA